MGCTDAVSEPQIPASTSGSAVKRGRGPDPATSSAQRGGVEGQGSGHGGRPPSLAPSSPHHRGCAAIASCCRMPSRRSQQQPIPLTIKHAVDAVLHLLPAQRHCRSSYAGAGVTTATAARPTAAACCRCCCRRVGINQVLQEQGNCYSVQRQAQERGRCRVPLLHHARCPAGLTLPARRRRSTTRCRFSAVPKQ